MNGLWLVYNNTQEYREACYRKRRNSRWGLIFVGSNTHENETHENLYTRRISNSNYGGLRSPTKINPLENLTHEILCARKFVHLRYWIMNNMLLCTVCVYIYVFV